MLFGSFWASYRLTSKGTTPLAPPDLSVLHTVSCCFFAEGLTPRTSLLSTVHHRGLRSPPVPTGVPPPLAARKVQQCPHGAAQGQLWSWRQQRLPAQAEPLAAHHLLTASTQLAHGQRAHAARAYSEPVGRRAVRCGPWPLPAGGGAAKHEHHCGLLGTQQQH